MDTISVLEFTFDKLSKKDAEKYAKNIIIFLEEMEIFDLGRVRFDEFSKNTFIELQYDKDLFLSGPDIKDITDYLTKFKNIVDFRYGVSHKRNEEPKWQFILSDYY